MTANDLADEILKDRKRQKSTEKQVGSLPKVIAIITEKQSDVFAKLQRVKIRKRSYDNSDGWFILGHATYGLLGTAKLGSGDVLIWGHLTEGIWGTNLWGTSAFDGWTTTYDSGDLLT